ncbi:hypothetical protein [Geopsychrobacter electrodiphilus]|uniref:hypothetical protein n=1 Tax=Geopsychrobacter electrodiphilus TaxID=225196 RepID=UPI000362CA6B|nr:hypothetical protein [Geopsychrobacter electrodiphilus]
MKSLRTLICVALICSWTLLCSWSASADSLRLLTDLKYDLNRSHKTDKYTLLETDSEQRNFSQIYNLEIQKEIFPTLKLNTSGLFDQNNSKNSSTDPTVSDGNSVENALRTSVDLQLTTPLLRAATGYRKSEVKRSLLSAVTTRNFTESYSTDLHWTPVELPRVDLVFARDLVYNLPRTNDQKTDTYQLRSKYSYQDYQFSYDHTTADALNKISEFKTLLNSDTGSVRLGRSFQQGRVSLNSSLRAARQQVDFTGIGERLVPPASNGVVIGRLDDASPATSNPEAGFVLSSIDLLVDSLLAARQLSFGLDFGTPTALDRLQVKFADLGSHTSNEFPWQIYIRDTETENWSLVSGVQQSTSLAGNAFDLKFLSIKTRYIKVVTTQQVQVGENLQITDLVPRRSLPPNSSTFSSMDWSGDLSTTWKMTDKTSTGYDLLYRERSSEPLGEKSSLVNAGVRLSHIFSKVFVGNTRLQHTEGWENGKTSSIDDTFSVALAARYLDTFNQNLTYSFSQLTDADSHTSDSHAVFLRNNLDLYKGWSMYLDNGYSLQHPADSSDIDTFFLRVGSNIIPNSWMNYTLSYGASWVHGGDKAEAHDQDGRLIATWVPTAAISLSADLSFTDKSGEIHESTAEQKYFVNWSPFRDGTLFISLTYGRTQNTDDKKIWTFSPSLHWQLNRKTLLTLEYLKGETEDQSEIVAFENFSLGIRVFY